MNYEKIHEDKRGEIYTLKLFNKTYWHMYTHKGHARGGDIHEGKQYNVVVTGKFLVRMIQKEGEKEVIICAGETIVIHKETPHVFIALEDSYMIEWHDHQLPPLEKKRIYQPYRELCG